MIEGQALIACFGVVAFTAFFAGYYVGRAERKSVLAFPDQTEAGGNPL